MCKGEGKYEGPERHWRHRLQVIDFAGRESQFEGVVERYKNYDIKIARRPAHDWLGDDPEISKSTIDVPSIKDEDCGVCDQPWRHAAILWDGRVAPCCNFYDGQFVLGDLNQNSMAEVWNGDSIVKFRGQHITKKRNCQKTSLEEKSLRVLENL